MGTLVCPRCGSREVVNINLTLERSGRVSFYSCHRCEKRWWHRDGEDVPLGGVLDLARRVPAPSTLLPAPPPAEG